MRREDASAAGYMLVADALTARVAHMEIGNIATSPNEALLLIRTKYVAINRMHIAALCG